MNVSLLMINILYIIYNMVLKDTDDLIDIIKILIDLLDDYENTKLKLRQFHYCIDCKQHFNRCKCDDGEEDNVSYSSSYSNIDDTYISSSDNE